MILEANNTVWQSTLVIVDSSVCQKKSTITNNPLQCNLDIVKKLVSGQLFTIRTFFTIQMFVSKDDMGCRFTPN